MTAPIQTAVLADTDDPACLLAVQALHHAYVPGELLPPDAIVVDPPTVTLISPSAGTPLRAGDAIVFDVTSATPFHLEGFTVRLVATGEREAAYDRTAPAGAWDPRYAGSSVEQLSATHYRLTLRRTTWPGGGVGILPRVSNAGGTAS